MRLARFLDSYNAEVYVNPDRVTFIRQFSNEMTTICSRQENLELLPGSLRQTTMYPALGCERKGLIFVS